LVFNEKLLFDIFNFLVVYISFTTDNWRSTCSEIGMYYPTQHKYFSFLLIQLYDLPKTFWKRKHYLSNVQKWLTSDILWNQVQKQIGCMCVGIAGWRGVGQKTSNVQPRDEVTSSYSIVIIFLVSMSSLFSTFWYKRHRKFAHSH
jgi:hypothetical protein